METTQRATESIPTACLRLGMSYNQVQRLVLLGRLRGTQDERGRWWIDSDSVRSFAESQAPTVGNAA